MRRGRPPPATRATFDRSLLLAHFGFATFSAPFVSLCSESRGPHRSLYAFYSFLMRFFFFYLRLRRRLSFGAFRSHLFSVCHNKV